MNSSSTPAKPGLQPFKIAAISAACALGLAAAVRADIKGTTLADTIELSPGPNAPVEQVVVSHSTHKTYVSGGAGARGAGLKVIDNLRGTVLHGLGLPTSGPLAVDEGTGALANRVYALVYTYVPPQSFPYAIRVIDGNNDTALTKTSTDIKLGEIIPNGIVVNPSTHKIYVFDQHGGVQVVDGTTRQLVASFNCLVSNPVVFAVNAATNKIFAFSQDNFAIIDGTSDTAQAVTPEFYPINAVFNRVDGHLYVTGIDRPSYSKRSLYVLDGNTGATLMTVNPTFASPGAMAVDGQSHRLFIAGIDNTNAAMIHVVDTVDFSLKRTYNYAGAPVSFDSANGGELVTVPSIDIDAINILKLADGTARPIVTAYTPARVAVNSKTDRVYITNERASEMTVLDAASHAVVARVPVRSPLVSRELNGVIPRDIAVSEALDRVYLTGFKSNSDGSRDGVIDVFDGATNAVIATVPTGPPPGDRTFVAVDDTRHKLYVVGGATVKGSLVYGLVVYSTETHALVDTISLPEGCNGLAVNQVTGRVYVSGGSGHRQMQVIDGNTDKIVASFDAGEPYDVAVNRKTNKVFVVRATNACSVLNGAADKYETSFSNTTANGVGQDNVANVSVDEVTNTIYLLDDANGNGGAGHVTAFDGDNNYAFLGQIGVGHVPIDADMDRSNRQLFVTNDTDGTVSVLQNSTPKTSELLGNISTRVRVGNSNDALIGGFIVTGPKGSVKTVLIRAIGPSLEAAGVTGAMSDTILELHDGQGNITTNDNWKTGGTYQTAGSSNKLPYPSQQGDIIATSIPPTDDRESAIIAKLPAGPATAIVNGANGASGVALVEVYDLDQNSPLQLANISTRGRVETGNNVMIGGIIILGSKQQQIIIRAIGPSLASAGVQSALQDTILELRDSNGQLVAINDDWQKEYPSDQVDPKRKQLIQATSIAPTDVHESAIVATLFPSNYTAIVRGKKDSGGNDSTGVALVEVYNLH